MASSSTTKDASDEQISQKQSTNNQNGDRKRATSMSELMAKYSNFFVPLKKGDIVKGRIIKINKNEILVDLHPRGEALVIEKDPHLAKILHAFVKEGDEVEATVVSTESESGQPLVSLRHFIEDQRWKRLEKLKKEGSVIKVTITEVTKGGYIVLSDDGQTGFLPFSHVLASQAHTLNVGKTVSVVVVDLDKRSKKVIFSQKATIPVENFKTLVSGVKVGDTIKAQIRTIAPFGYFVTFSPQGREDVTLDGLIHISEISWEKLDNPLAVYKIGDIVECVVIGINVEERRVDLSIKRLQEDPFEKLKEKFYIDREVSGEVIRIEEGNVIVDLGEGIEGVIKKEKISPTTKYEIGQNVSAVVSAHDTRRRRIELTPILKEKPLMYR